MYVKFHKSKDSEVVAICDEGLIGKELRSGDLSLDVSNDFYKGELRDRDEVKRMLKEAMNINLVGNECVGIAIELGLVEKDNVLMFGNVAYAQVLVI